MFRRAKLFVYGETMLDKGTGIKTWREQVRLINPSNFIFVASDLPY